jgi:V/A-type H+/Na+-transporting ATPase subunit I
MGIVAMKKIVIYCMASHQDMLLTELQKFSGLELIDFRNPAVKEEFPEVTSAADSHRISQLEECLNRAEFCIETIAQMDPPVKGLKKLLIHKPTLTYEERRFRSLQIPWNETWQALKEADETLRRISIERSKATAEIESLRPWTAFDASTTDLNELVFAGYALGSLPTAEIELLTPVLQNQFPDAELEIIQPLKDETLILILYHHDDQEELSGLLKNHNFTKQPQVFEAPPSRMMAASQERIDSLNLEQSCVIDAIRDHSQSLDELKLIRDYYASEIRKVQGSEQMAHTEHVLLAEGWVAGDRVTELESLISSLTREDYAIELTDPAENEDVPVLLKNNFFVEAFEPVTAMYSLPSYYETDPTPVYAPFMFVFFGMMLSDVAYGFFLSAGSFWALKTMDLKESHRKFVKLFFFLGLSAIFFGVLYGSYFGDVFSGFIRPAWLDPAADPLSVLKAAIVMGGIHLFTGLGIKAYNLMKRGHVLDAVFDIGFWYVTLTGAVLVLFGPEQIGRPMLIAGLLGLVLTQGRENKSLFGKLAGGFFGLYSITGYLGDVLSYSRLLALGLATGLIGSSFNLLARLVGFSPLVIVFAVIIFLGGHTFNLLINILGAYVHAVRLQYLEFFGKFYTGGGRAFAPLSSEMKYHTLIKQEVSDHGND